MLAVIQSFYTLPCLLLWTQVSPLTSVLFKWDFLLCALLIVRLGLSPVLFSLYSW